MSQYHAQINWKCNTDSFIDNKYSRAHSWTFDGGLTVPASSSPSIVPEPWSDASNLDPEEAFVAALSSCHMLWFLSLAQNRGFAVSSYTDGAIGTMNKNAQGKLAITEVELNPKVEFDKVHEPTKAELNELHETAHDNCFIANSVISAITINPVF